jgi:hypothetical protein
MNMVVMSKTKPEEQGQVSRVRRNQLSSGSLQPKLRSKDEEPATEAAGVNGYRQGFFEDDHQSLSWASRLSLVDLEDEELVLTEVDLGQPTLASRHWKTNQKTTSSQINRILRYAMHFII